MREAIQNSEPKFSLFRYKFHRWRSSPCQGKLFRASSASWDGCDSTPWLATEKGLVFWTSLQHESKP